MAIPFMEDCIAYSFNRNSSSIRLRSVMSIKEAIMHTGLPSSSLTKLAESSTTTGLPSFLFPTTSPFHTPCSRTVLSISIPVSIDSAKIMAGLPKISETSSPPHILKNALFAYVIFPSRSAMAIPFMEDCIAYSFNRNSSSIRLRSVMSIKEAMVHIGFPLSSKTRFADRYTTILEPSFLFPDISPDHQPLLISVSSACLASSSDSANSTAHLPSISDASSPPHIFSAASFTYITLPSRSPSAMPLMEETIALSLIFISSSMPLLMIIA